MNIIWTLKDIRFFFRKLKYRFRFFKRIWEHYFAPWDMGDAILGINMELLCEFMEHGGGESIEWLSCENTANANKKMVQCYNWWKYERPIRLEEIDVVRDTWHEHHVSWWDPIDDKYYLYNTVDTKYCEYLFDLLGKLEKQLYKDEEKYLKMIIEIKDYLWS